jgi:hypothetical protein
MKEFPLFNIELIIQKDSYPRVIRDEEELIMEGIALQEIKSIPKYGILTSQGKLKKIPFQENLDGIQVQVNLDEDIKNTLLKAYSLPLVQTIDVLLEKKETAFSYQHKYQVYTFPEIKEMAEKLYLSYKEEDIAHEIKSHFNNQKLYRILSKEELEKRTTKSFTITNKT